MKVRCVACGTLLVTLVVEKMDTEIRIDVCCYKCGALNCEMNNWLTPEKAKQMFK
jgi:hypothetical protein